MFWADAIVQEIIAQRKPPFKVYDWWTPSGLAHAGHIRTFLLHQAVYEGLKLHGQEATYFYGFDDIDPMDGFPPDLPEEFRQYMGQPLSRIPSPVPGYKSLGAYYSARYLEAMEILDVHPEVPSTTEMYQSGQFNEAITIVLDNAEAIRAIYADLGAERPDDWHALNVICQACGKIGTTYVYAWDGSVVSYRCEPKLVTWAEGCGHEGQISPYNGNAKMPWKPEWAAKWWLLNEDYEGGGKDHYTKNGSRDYGRRIVRDIFHAQEPIGYPHEFFLIGGKKQASSKGLGQTANEAASILPPAVMRFFVYRTVPNRQIEFNPEGDTIPRIYDDFDRALAGYRADPEADLSRALVYAYQGETDLPSYVMRFAKVSFLIQMPHMDINQLAQEEKGAPLTASESRELGLRIEYARRWLDTYATEEARFTLQPELPSVELSQEQRVYLSQLGQQLQESEWEGESVHSIVHDLKNTMQLAPKVAFGALYRVFLNKDHGPQAGWFLASLDRHFVLDRLRYASEKGEAHA